jgi:HEAT repeat protein
LTTPEWPHVQRLLDDLDDPGWRIRSRAARGLGEIGEGRAVVQLLRALGDRSAAVRREAAGALGRIRDGRAVGPLVAALGDADDEVSTRAAEALKLKRFGEAAFAALLDAFKGGSPRIRHAVIGVIGNFQVASVSELLIAALDDPDHALRSAALAALVIRKDPRAVERLIAGLGDVPPWREVYAWALGMIGAPEAFQPLRDRLDTDDPAFQMAVVKALRKIDNAQAVDLLHAQLDDADNPGRDRLVRTIAALDLLGAIGSLCRKVKQGGVDLDRLHRALEAVHVEAEESIQRNSAAAPFLAPREDLRRSASAMRRLEANIRDLAQDG